MNAVWDLDWQSPFTFASCDIDGAMFFSDIRLVNRPHFKYTGHKVAIICKIQRYTDCLRWDPDNQLLVSCSSDATVKVSIEIVFPSF